MLCRAIRDCSPW